MPSSVTTLTEYSLTVAAPLSPSRARSVPVTAVIATASGRPAATTPPKMITSATSSTANATLSPTARALTDWSANARSAILVTSTSAPPKTAPAIMMASKTPMTGQRQRSISVPSSANTAVCKHVGRFAPSFHFPTPPRTRPAPRDLGRFLEALEAERAGNDHPLHLRGALADLQDLGVAPHAGDRRLVHEAVAAVNLRRLARVGHRDLAGVELGDRGLPLELMTAGQAGRRVVVRQARRVCPQLHVGQFELDRL